MTNTTEQSSLTPPLLTIEDLHVSVEGHTIVDPLNLSIAPGEVHVIMGPNGCGKSTLSRALIGDEAYRVERGNVTFLGQDLLQMPIEARALAGLFLSFQTPIALPGVSNIQFLKASVNHIREAQGLDPLDAIDLLEQAKAAFRTVGLSEAFISRPVNDGFSGGEKKRNELAQMLLIKPKLAILDEIDSGLDVDALKIVAECINTLKAEGTSFLIITHYQRLLQAVEPDTVHLLRQGSIQRSGGPELAHTIEKLGYEAAASA